VQLPDGSEIELVARTLGPERERDRHSTAQLAAFEMKKKLDDESSMEYQLNLSRLEDVPRDRLLEIIKDGKRREIVADVALEIFTVPDEWKTSNLLEMAEREEAEQENINWLRRYRENQVEARLEEFVNGIDNAGDDVLQTEARRAIINTMMTVEWEKYFVAYTLQHGIFYPKKTKNGWKAGDPYFDEDELPVDADSVLKSTLIDFYFQLDPGSQDPSS